MFVLSIEIVTIALLGLCACFLLLFFITGAPRHPVVTAPAARSPHHGTTGPHIMGLPVPESWDYRSPHHGTAGPHIMGLPVPESWDCRSPNHGTKNLYEMAHRFGCSITGSG